MSVTMCRLRPMIFLAGSMPWPVRWTVAEVLMLWLSIRQALGSLVRPSAWRTLPRKRPVSWSKMPSASQWAK